MKLSFVIPAHNEETYIGKCLESIIKEVQTFPSGTTEIVVVNNASTDRTKEIALGYPGVRVVDEPRKGLLWARQAGFLSTGGDLLANVDADTILPKGWIKKAIKEFERDPKLVALSGPHYHYDLPRRMGILTRTFYGLVFLSYLVNRYILRISSFVQGGNFVVRRSAIKEIGGFNTSLEFYGEDADLAYRLHRVGHVKFSWKLPIYASGRRLAQEGALTMALRYATNYFWIVFFQKPFTKQSKDIRYTTTDAINYQPEKLGREWAIGLATLSIVTILVLGGSYFIYRVFMDGSKGFLAFLHLEAQAQKLEDKLNTFSEKLRLR